MEKLFPVNVCVQFVFLQATHGTLNAENYYYYENKPLDALRPSSPDAQLLFPHVDINLSSHTSSSCISVHE